MRYIIRLFILICVLSLTACGRLTENVPITTEQSEAVSTPVSDKASAQEKTGYEPSEPISEWKTTYFQLIKNVITGDMKSRGVMVRYGIELYDMDNDGIPELQEHYISGGQSDYHYIWFVEDGEATYFIGEMPDSVGSWTNGHFDGLFFDDESGESILIHTVTHFMNVHTYIFEPSESKEIWKLHSLFKLNNLNAPGTPIDYYCVDSNGVEHVMREQEYNELYDQLYTQYHKLEGKFLSLESLYPWSYDTARAVSDYFDSYDGIHSNVVGIMD